MSRSPLLSAMFSTLTKPRRRSDMLKTLAILMPVLLAPVTSQAGTFYDSHCSDLKGDPVRAAHVVGWLNLQNRDGLTDTMDFLASARDTQKLIATCAEYPEMPLHWAATSFEQIDNEGARIYPKDTTPVGSIPAKRAGLD
jgi:hypothetical protein